MEEDFNFNEYLKEREKAFNEGYKEAKEKDKNKNDS